MRKHIAQLKKKRPVYKEILNFYERVLEKQEGIKPTLNVAPIEMREDLRALQIKEGYSPHQQGRLYSGYPLFSQAI